MNIRSSFLSLVQIAVGSVIIGFVLYIVGFGVVMIWSFGWIYHDMFMVPPPKCFHGLSSQGVPVPSNDCWSAK